MAAVRSVPGLAAQLGLALLMPRLPAAQAAFTRLNDVVRALPLVLLTSALSALPHHWRVLPRVVRDFANFSGLGVMVGGLGAVTPSQRDGIVRLGTKAPVAGNPATCLTGAAVALPA